MFGGYCGKFVYMGINMWIIDVLPVDVLTVRRTLCKRMVTNEICSHFSSIKDVAVDFEAVNGYVLALQHSGRIEVREHKYGLQWMILVFAKMKYCDMVEGADSSLNMSIAFMQSTEKMRLPHNVNEIYVFIWNFFVYAVGRVLSFTSIEQ